jgi:hypothetical protein
LTEFGLVVILTTGTHWPVLVQALKCNKSLARLEINGDIPGELIDILEENKLQSLTIHVHLPISMYGALFKSHSLTNLELFRVTESDSDALVHLLKFHR